MKKIALLLLVVAAVAAFLFFRTAKSFVNCEFRFEKVSKVLLADIDITHKNGIGGLGFSDAAKLLSALQQKNLKMDLGIDLMVSNPNDVPAVLDGMDYILWIDGGQVAEGSLEQEVSVAAKQEAVVTLPCEIDVYDVLTSDKLESISDFAFGLANGNADASRLKISLKPYFTIAGETVKFPSHITIGGDRLMPKN